MVRAAMKRRPLRTKPIAAEDADAAKFHGLGERFQIADIGFPRTVPCPVVDAEDEGPSRTQPALEAAEETVGRGVQVANAIEAGNGVKVVRRKLGLSVQDIARDELHAESAMEIQQSGRMAGELVDQGHLNSQCGASWREQSGAAPDFADAGMRANRTSKQAQMEGSPGDLL